MEEKKIMFDMDGVLCDFVLGYENMFPGADINNKPHLDENKKLFAQNKFFLDLPKLQDGIDLLLYVESLGVKPIILTAVGDNDTETNALHKEEWIKNNLGDYEFNWVKKAHHKKIYANNNVLLVDDRIKSTKPFLENNGKVILFSTTNIDNHKKDINNFLEI